MKGIDTPSIQKTAKHYFMLAVLAILLSFQAAIASINTGLSGDDKWAGPFPIGFEFQYYDQTFTKFYVTTNGLVQFTNPTAAYANRCLPKHRNSLFVFWDDLKTKAKNRPEGLIQYDTQGQAPDRKLIVQWTNQYYVTSGLPMGTFQVVLFEKNNEIKYQYRSLNEERSHGSYATIGIGGPDNNAVQIGCNEANVIDEGQAILFTPDGNGNYLVNKHAHYDFIDIAGLTPSIESPARYTNEAPTWRWNKIASLTTYQIEIQTPSGDVLLNQTLGDVDSFTYSAGVEHGKTYMARVRGSINNGGTWEIWSGLSSFSTIDTVSPSAVIHDFNRTGNTQAQVRYSLSDDLSGVKTAHVQIATDDEFKQIVLEREMSVNSTVHHIAGLAQLDALFARVNAVDNAGNTSQYSDVKSIVFEPPRLITPVTGATVRSPEVEISAQTIAQGDVQIYVDGKAFGQRLKADEKGHFATFITLRNEGAHSVSLDVQTPYAVSDKSLPVTINYKATLPTALFVKPAEDALISAPIDIEVSAVDEVGLERVEVYVDETLLTTLTTAPYTVYWPAEGIAEGRHELKAIATNKSGKSKTIKRHVEVNLVPLAPLTRYTGAIESITPAISYGTEAVLIKGKAVERVANQPVANSSLRLVLTVDGFKRQINLVTDINGEFNYRFIPQQGDSGVYQVAVIHPKENDALPLGEFTISRIKFNAAYHNLTAARAIPARIEVTASVIEDTKGLRWVLRESDQPGGRLPQGISINSANGVDIDAGKSASLPALFTADDTAAETGTIVLTALADTSGQQSRGRLSVNYRLVAAEAALYTKNSVVETGVRQEEVVTEEITLGNRGLVAANNVSIALVDSKGNQPPDWVFLTSNESQGTLKVGDTMTFQLVAQPDNRVADGIYRFNLTVNADNSRGGNIPVSISVLQSGEGAVRFDVADIYTATLDKQGLPIQGVKGATIKLQNEAVLTDTHTLKTDENGIAYIHALSPGVYLYRASASQHSDVSGRLRVRPGVTNNQHIFLDYQTVSIDFSVTETTVKDVYDIELEATFNTQVPAPVVVFSPLSINLAGLQVGEEKTGQLTLTNYGLVQADSVNFRLPQSDEQFKFEFFGEVPEILPPKTQIVIPYRVTALKVMGRESRSLNEIANKSVFSAVSKATRAGQCSSYNKGYSVDYQYKCANDDVTRGGGSGHFYSLNGSNCGSGSGGVWGGWGGGGGFGGGHGSSPSAIPMAPQCAKDCTDGQCCKPEGEKSGGQ